MNKAVQRIIKLKADTNGNVAVPDSINLMKTGHWHTPWHGAFEMTAADLAEMVSNFAKGIGLVEGSNRAPINYGHDQGGKAAGWINNLRVEGEELWGDIEWTPAGRKALEDGEYRYISPEWNPRDFPWENPQVEGEFVDNVFNGAALTNIPLFTKLKPVMASRDAANGGSDTSNVNEGEDMDLSQVRVKKLEELTDEEKAFLAEHKDELTEEERQAFGLTEAESSDDATEEESTEEANTDEEQATEEDETTDGEAEDEGTDDTTGSDLKGSAKPVTIAADKLAQLEADAKEARQLRADKAKSEAQTVMASAIDTGRVKQDQEDAGVELLLADRDGKFKAFIEALPENKLLAGDKGKAAGDDDVVITDQEKELADAFGNTPEEIADYKKSNETKE